MFLAKVIGNVVATQKDPKFQGMKLLLVQPYVTQERALVPSGSSVVAVDSVGAGRGRVRALHPGQLGAAHAEHEGQRPSTP